MLNLIPIGSIRQIFPKFGTFQSNIPSTFIGGLTRQIVLDFAWRDKKSFRGEGDTCHHFSPPPRRNPKISNEINDICIGEYLNYLCLKSYPRANFENILASFALTFKTLPKIQNLNKEFNCS